MGKPARSVWSILLRRAAVLMTLVVTFAGFSAIRPPPDEPARRAEATLSSAPATVQAIPGSGAEAESSRAHHSPADASQPSAEAASTSSVGSGEGTAPSSSGPLTSEPPGATTDSGSPPPGSNDQTAQPTATAAPSTSHVPTTLAPSSTLAGEFDRIINSPTAGISVPAGEHWRIRGPSLGGPSVMTLTADVHVMGRLSLDADVTLDGGGRFAIHAHGGGILDFQGTPQTAWLRWGDTPQGWRTGDRLVVAPTASGVVGPGAETTWGGSWAATTRPGSSPDVALHGETLRPEVANMTQSITLRGITRIMIHESGGIANVHTLKHFRCIDCGQTDVLGMYPIHFHLVGNSARGSLVEGVVVENGRFRAFVPHGSHGITFRDTVAYNTTRSAYWWDSNSNPNDPGGHNASNNTVWDRALALGVSGTRTDLGEFHRTSGFRLGSGSGNVVKDSVATGVDGGQNAAGFLWPEDDHDVWGFSNNLAHNNRNGIYVWQNDDLSHAIHSYEGYRNSDSDINHGAYKNAYRYVDVSAERIRSLAQSSSSARQRWDRLRAAEFHILEHKLGSDHPVEIVACQVGRVIVNETGPEKGWYHFIDCGLTPDAFTFSQVHPGTVIEISEGGALRHRWATGTWNSS